MRENIRDDLYPVRRIRAAQHPRVFIRQRLNECFFYSQGLIAFKAFMADKVRQIGHICGIIRQGE